MKNHVAVRPDKDIDLGFHSEGNDEFRFSCKGEGYWFEYTAMVDPIWVNDKLIVPKKEVIMKDNKPWNDFLVIRGSEGEGEVVYGKWQGKKIKYEGAEIGLDFYSELSYITQDQVLWIH